MAKLDLGSYVYPSVYPCQADEKNHVDSRFGQHPYPNLMNDVITPQYPSLLMISWVIILPFIEGDYFITLYRGHIGDFSHSSAAPWLCPGWPRCRLRDYNERTSRILGGRLSVTCENGVSLMCLVNNPLFDAVAAPWEEELGGFSWGISRDDCIMMYNIIVCIYNYI